MGKEENIESIERAAKTVQITGRVSQAVKDEFEQLREAGGYETFSLFMEALLERYNNPLKINKENAGRIADLEKQLSVAEKQISEGDSYVGELEEKLKSKESDFEQLRAEYNAALAKIEQLTRDNAAQLESLSEYDTLKKEVDGCISVPVTPLHLKCLRYLADRENRNRKRNDITPAAFYQFAIDEIFIKGNKFAIDSVPDHILRKFEEEIKNGK